MSEYCKNCKDLQETIDRLTKELYDVTMVADSHGAMEVSFRKTIHCLTAKLAEANREVSDMSVKYEYLPAVERVKVDRWREALIKLRDCDWATSLPDRMDAVRDIARQALTETEDK